MASPVMTDRRWAVLLGAVSLGWYLLQVALGTDFFFENGGPTISAGAVGGTSLVLVAQSVPLLLRTRRPALSFWLVFLGFLACVALSVDRSLAVSATYLFSVLSVVVHLPTRGWAPMLSVAAAIDTLVYLALIAIQSQAAPSLYIVTLLAFKVLPAYVAPILAGLLFASQRRRAQLATENARVHAERAQALERVSEAQLAAAITAERNAMARELHDLAAHHLSGLVLQAAGAREVIHSRPAVAESLLDGIRSEASNALHNLRDVVVSLRDDERPGRGRIEPTLTALPELIDSVRVLHPALDLHVEGDIDDLSPTVSLACYRIIQESLTNARRHAPGTPVRVEVQRRARRLELDVTNALLPGTPPQSRADRPGFGLIGMRERVTMLGGTFDAGPADDGGWRTHAVIPTDRMVLS